MSELEHSRNQNCECRIITRLTSVIAIADIITGLTWLIKYLATSYSMAMSQTLSLGVEYGLTMRD